MELQGLIPARAGKTSPRRTTAANWSAHPRACGENARTTWEEPAAYGSSPRVRGKQRRWDVHDAVLGLIPARAGKTPTSRPRGATARAHPRACGENGSNFTGVTAVRGSSPRVRGKHAHPTQHGRRTRLIPARAGKTVIIQASRAVNTAHPRACGKNGHHPGEPGGEHGSSPRVRGKQRERPLDEPQPGLIPARAGKTKGRCATRASRRAHPRACGENGDVGGPQAGGLGSSPRVRGKPSSRQHRPPRQRLIPARAGKTPCVEVAPGFPRAHPRACGENPRRRARRRGRRGSSPRVRGKLPGGLSWGNKRGLIPARAGKTALTSSRSRTTPAHPRACGENLARLASPSPWPGSSPRVRGKPGKAGQSIPLARLIPARAGKTPRGRPAGGRRRAHPRACGENRAGGAPGSAMSGSSPRVRGKRVSGCGCAFVVRLIPARAGKTRRRRRGGRAGWAHPRACGENSWADKVPGDLLGSSPRVRGKRAFSSCQSRLIPARAGKTSGLSRGRSGRWAHPRACGENSWPSCPLTTTRGSSPRVRGKHAGGEPPTPVVRLIPARAGKTSARKRSPGPGPAHPRACGENELVVRR